MDTTVEELRTRLAVQRTEVSQDLEFIGDRVSPGRVAQRRKAAVRERAVGLKERIMGVAADAKETTTQRASSVTDAVREGPEAALRTTEGNPLAAGLVAFGAGLLLAAVLPETRTESELAAKIHPQLEEVAHAVGDVAGETMESVKPKAQEAVDDLKRTAQNAASTVTIEAQQAARDVGRSGPNA
jgi:ElaB/YqjD/DUF883 family membrane-anchored ribosome-binding protein